jgi:branched-chain amino acid transport system substrate-binding protein
MRSIALILAAAAAVACGDDSSEDEPIAIGVVASVTGDLAIVSEGDRKAFELAIGEINAAGGVLGRPLELDMQDDGTTPQGSELAYASLINHEAPAVLGPAYSEGVVAIEQQLRDGGTLTIGTATTSPALTDLDDGGNFFRTCPSDAVQGVVLAQLIVDQGRENICLVYRQDAYGVGLAEAMMSHLDEGVNVIEAAYDPSMGDLSAVMDPCDSILDAGNTGAVFVTFEADGRLILDDAIARGWNASGTRRIFMVDGNKNQEIIDSLEDPSAMNGTLGTAPSGPPADSPGGMRLAAFYDAYADRYGEQPAVFAENAYDAVYVIAAAIEIAGTVTDRAAIRDALGSLSSGPAAAAGDWPAIADGAAAGELDLLGASGEIELDLATGDLLPPYYIGVWAIREGVVADEEVVTVEAL